MIYLSVYLSICFTVKYQSTGLNSDILKFDIKFSNNQSKNQLLFILFFCFVLFYLFIFLKDLCYYWK